MSSSRRANSALLIIAAVLFSGLLAGCASTSTPAPVFDRHAPQGVEKAASVELKPGEYMVKKGDTLRSIALDHGQDYKDLAAWNNLDNPNLINAGQVLRVAPPDAAGVPPAVAAGEGVEVHAIAPPSQIESIPVDGKPAASAMPVAPAAVATGELKREPKGGTQPYSDDAWAQLQKPQAPAALVPTPTPPAASTPATPPAESVAKPAAAMAATDIAWAWPTSNKVVATFSDGSNKGFDFEGKPGDPVLAAASGKVTLVTNSLRGYGNLIVVKHNASYLSVYAHNSKMLVKEGQSIAAGQKIAEIGSSDSDRPKLHFEIRREGKPVDPGKYLPQR